jgi:hypothetical protein
MSPTLPMIQYNVIILVLANEHGLCSVLEHRFVGYLLLFGRWHIPEALLAQTITSMNLILFLGSL